MLCTTVDENKESYVCFIFFFKNEMIERMNVLIKYNHKKTFQIHYLWFICEDIEGAFSRPCNKKYPPQNRPVLYILSFSSSPHNDKNNTGVWSFHNFVRDSEFVQFFPSSSLCSSRFLLWISSS